VNTTTDLRNQIAEIENKRIALEAERDDVSFAALVERDPDAIKRAADIGDELAQLGHQEAMLNAALRTAIKREAEAAAAESADRKRADLEKALAMLPQVEAMSAQIDDAMKVLRDTTVAFEEKWATIKQLSGAGRCLAPLKFTSAAHSGRVCVGYLVFKLIWFPLPNAPRLLRSVRAGPNRSAGLQRVKSGRTLRPHLANRKARKPPWRHRRSKWTLWILQKS
jgi:hypothetical protein